MGGKISTTLTPGWRLALQRKNKRLQEPGPYQDRDRDTVGPFGEGGIQRRDGWGTGWDSAKVPFQTASQKLAAAWQKVNPADN